MKTHFKYQPDVCVHHGTFLESDLVSSLPPLEGAYILHIEHIDYEKDVTKLHIGSSALWFGLYVIHTSVTNSNAFISENKCGQEINRKVDFSH